MRVRKLFAAFTALALALSLGSASLAAEPSAAQKPDAWVYEFFADAYALGLVDDGYGSYIRSPITRAQLDALTGVVEDKLSRLDLPRRDYTPPDTRPELTRGGVMEALYRVCAAYDLPGIETGAVPFLRALEVVQGVNSAGDLAQSRPCRYQEAMVMALRLIYAVYDSRDAGSRGLLWRVSSGEQTLYLLGTVHTGGELYPLHRSLREAVSAADRVVLEVDFNDRTDYAAYTAMQTYEQGSLAGHIDPDLYRRTASLCAQLGIRERSMAAYKPWALALLLSAVTSPNAESAPTPMAVDLYLNAAAVNTGRSVTALESYVFQGEIFDSLSPEYQAQLLAQAVDSAQALLAGEPSPEAETTQAMLAAWQAGDSEACAALYNKSAAAEDELEAKLFARRDPAMTEAAAALLRAEGGGCSLMAVGAGHLLDPGGVLSGLRRLGYTVEPVR